MIGFAYGVSMDLVRGGAGWIMSGDDRFDLEAKAEDPAAATEGQLIEMLRNTLADRFKLKFHRETREAPGFALIVARGGSRLQSSGTAKSTTAVGIRTVDGKFTVAIPGFNGATAADVKSAEAGVPMSLTAQGASMDEFVVMLRSFSRGPIVNRTQLDGSYDFKLMWESGQALSGPLQEQLGLRLEAQTVAVDYFIIDSADKPTTN